MDTIYDAKLLIVDDNADLLALLCDCGAQDMVISEQLPG